MRIIVLTIFLLPRLTVIGQPLNDWLDKTDSISHLITESADKSAFEKIISKRTAHFKKDFTDTTFTLIRVTERYDTKTNEFEIFIHYVPEAYKESSIEEWTFLPVDSIKPRNYKLPLGCFIRDRHKRKVKRWEKRIDQMDLTKETYYIIESLFDRSTDTIKVSFQIPATGKRTLEASYGPFGKSRKPYLVTWD
jgi:hypothetical protein